MKKKVILILGVSLLVSLLIAPSCTRYSPEIEPVLRKADDNRSELEKVLKHYGKNKLPRFIMDKDFPAMNYSQLMATAKGRCTDMAALSVFAMRALGIPVTIEYTPYWIQGTAGHDWNAVRDSAGRYVSFMGADIPPGKSHLGTILLKGKVYRRTFANQAGIHTTERNIPPLLNECKNIQDVSALYADCVDTVTVSLRYPSPAPTGYVYLAFENNYQWYPIAWSADSVQTVRFTSIGRNIIYQPVYYSAGTVTPAGDPFWLDDKGEMIIFAPDSPDSLLTFKGIEPVEGNSILEGHEYELFYRSKDGWTSLGKQVADSNVLQYRTPTRALIYLENVTSRRKGWLTFFTPEQKTGWRVYDIQKAVIVL